MQLTTDRHNFRKIFFTLGGSVMGIFILFVVLGVLFFRSEIRHQILQRDGILLTSVANYLSEHQSVKDLEDWELLQVALDSSDIRGIIAVRVFDPAGQFSQGVPASLYSVTLSPEDRAILERGDPVIRYFSDYPLYALFSDFALFNADKVPLVEVVAPLVDQEDTLIASIQYWSDGTDVKEEFHNLDQYLATMGTLLISGGVIIFSILFLFARRRLLQMAALLAERNLSLEKANADLSMAARTSAIGSVASHLFHGLKNPLAGLKTYLKVTGRDEEAVAMTDRMQGLIDESLSVIRDQDFATEINFSIEELREICWKRLQDLATKEGKELVIKASGSGQLDGRQVQLLLLVIRNLVENAIAASPDKGIVRIDLQQEDDTFTVEVSDSGPGLPESIKSRLFEPSHSTKSGGTGIGLTISSVIARHIPATLELKSSNPDGTIFAIRMSNKR